MSKADLKKKVNFHCQKTCNKCRCKCIFIDLYSNHLYLILRYINIYCEIQKIFSICSNKFGWWAREWWRIWFGRYFFIQMITMLWTFNLFSYLIIIAQLFLLSFQIVKMKSLDGARRRKINVTELEFKWSVHQHVMPAVKMFGPIQNARIESRNVKIEMSREIVEKLVNVFNPLIIKSRQIMKSIE